VASPQPAPLGATGGGTVASASADMQRLSIARSLRLALTGLTVVLAVIAALGVASLYHARQDYERTLSRSSDLSSAAAELATASIVGQEVTRYGRGPDAARARGQARAEYLASAARARALAADDPASQRLLNAMVADGYNPATLRGATALQARQDARQRQARATAQSRSHRALRTVVVAGALALVLALALIALVIRSMRGPLDSLVDATKQLAAGDLGQRVVPAGPSELRALGESFNAMGDELQSAAERLIQARERLATTISSLGDGLLVTEPSSSQIATTNPRAAALLPELSPGRQIDGPGSPLPRLEDLGDGETTIEHHGRTLALTAAPLGHDHLTGTVWTVRDITERARLERAKSDFVATASHELRSPLTSIKGFVELLAAAPGDMTERQREFVSIILRSTDRLVDLVNDLLDVARLEADHVEIVRRPVDAGEILSEAVELMGPRATAKHQTITAEIAAALPPVLADPSRLRQILANLLTNAHMYTPQDGHIVAGVAAEGARIRIWVTDDGVGMSAAQRERIFDRFYRAVDDRSSPGTGLGLSIVKSLVDLHAGTIEVRAEPGGGTTFTVWLPGAGAEGLSPSVEALRGRRVLVVDDERDIAQLIADQLAPFGVQATITSSGAEALEQLRTEPFDAVTLDVKMPELDGIGVLRKIRETPGLEKIPVVFVSVFTDRQELAGEWLVSKPIDSDELRDVLGAAVSTGRTRALIVGRPELQPELQQPLQSLRVEYQWETSGVAAARACRDRRFEVALVDIGLPNPQAVLQALSLRGRRVRRAIVLFSDGTTPVPAGIARLGLEVVPIERVAGSLVEALKPENGESAASGTSAR
jgi:signal transduction histidine kinase/DNA-binding response OmpR family regulator/HAMP domain-containing protein